MRRIVFLATWTIAILLASGVCLASLSAAEVSPQAVKKPNFVFILADDMRYDDLKYMPKTQALLGAKGMRFKSAFVSNATCCPSRATIMRGQYSHNTGVWKNVNSQFGGWEGYKKNGNEKDNVATRLRGAGYMTGLFGKYLNGYEKTTFVPRGWVDWFASIGCCRNYFDYLVNDNGTIKHYGSDPSDYSTDVLKSQTIQFINASVSKRKPFFAYVAPAAPHKPSTPAPRDSHTYDGLKAPRPPSFNEKDVSDKPPWISGSPKLSGDQIAEIDANHEKRAESLRAVDDLVVGVVNKLGRAGVLNNTYIIFTSDNGWENGEHRLAKGKQLPYEESIRAPLLVRGPGVAAGSSTKKLVLNTDFLPTFTDLADIKTPSYVDGRSLRPVLKGNAVDWRTAILLETRTSTASMNYGGIRTRAGSKYVEYEGGFRELYNLKQDPYELHNGYAAANPPTELAARLQALQNCARDSCRAAEDGQ
jgi:N-acetylglucosamine-6-sulfatase